MDLTARVAALLALVLACAPLVPAAGEPSLLGEWTLVEQTYGEGRANLVAEEARPLRISFARQGAQIRGSLRAGDDDAEMLSWPRLVADSSRRIDVEEQRFSAAEDHVLTRYRVAPTPGDDLVLVVTEEYTVVEQGRALVGTVRVEFLRDGEERGSYRLRRRFEREP